MKMKQNEMKLNNLKQCPLLKKYSDNDLGKFTTLFAVHFGINDTEAHKFKDKYINDPKKMNQVYDELCEWAYHQFKDELKKENIS